MKMPPHSHCPRGCEHPQPFIRDGKQYCGLCRFFHVRLVEMVPCTPETCGQGESP
jgi:hypothetical protein